MNKKVILSTGGTGGHIFPMIALYEYLISKNYDVSFVTDQRGEKYFTDNIKHKIKIFNINSPFNQKGLFKIISIFQLFASTIHSLFFLIKCRPKVIIGSGGYASFPILMAGYILKINILTYETNTILGRTNKFFYPFAKKLLLGFDILNKLQNKYQSKARHVGQLIRTSFKRNAIKKENNNLFTILILGGSQAADFFGEDFAKLLSELDNDFFKIKIFHQCKKNQIDKLKLAYSDSVNCELFDFKPNIAQLMLEADIAITRSGSSAISEMVSLNLPFIAIPLPTSLDNHQYHNAKYFENKGFCWLVEQNFFNLYKFKKMIIDIVSNDREQLKIKLENMKTASKENVLIKFENEIKEYF